MPLPSTLSLPADYYRKHAALVRAFAADATTPGIKEHLFEVARRYDGLAEQADAAARIEAGPA